MSSGQTITPSIYRLDLNKVHYLAGDKDKNTEINAKNADTYILAYQERQRERGLTKAKPFKKKIGPLGVGQYTVVVYGTDAFATKPHPWKNLFPEEIPGLDVKYPNLAAFIATEDNCYAISAGQGHNLFDQFIDTSFPLEVARHIMKPEMTGTETREIAGAIYGQLRQYRTSQMMVSSQTLGTVWRTLKGEITEEVKSSPGFEAIFHPDKRKISVVAGGSLTISKSVDVGKMVELLDWLMHMLDEELTPEQEENFRFLNGLKEISSRKGKVEIAELRASLGDQLLSSIKAGNVEFDYSHKNFIAYQEAEAYDFGTSRRLKDLSWSTPPTANEVLVAMRDAGEFDSCKSGADLLEVLEKTLFFATYSDEVRNKYASVLAHLHGEVEHDGRRYFLVDGTWYQATDGFIKRLSADFQKLLAGEYFANTGISLAEYKNFAKEGDYNDSYIKKDGWLVADRVFIGNVEIADLLHWNDGKLYIIHNKLGFGVTMRDVCSQILNSMNIVNRMKDGTELAQIKEYYNRIQKKHYKSGGMPLTQDEFVSLLTKTSGSDIVYVIGYVRKKPADADIQSNIAKFEAVKLCYADSKPFDFKLKIAHIPQSTT